MHELVPGFHPAAAGCKCEVSVAEPDWSRVLDGHTGSTDGSIGPVPQQGVS